jgi:hypothetical protein
VISRTLATAAALLALAAAPAAAAFTPGSDGAGDPFFPQGGNGGYEVSHYSLKLDYEPQNEQLAGDAAISARATQDLSRFNLDLVGFKVSSVTVNGTAASFSRKGQELAPPQSRLQRPCGLRRPRELRARPRQVQGRLDSH